MGVISKVVFAILVFMAISSGISKIMLMPQEVEFFGAQGFSNAVLVAFGVAQLIGGVLLLLPKVRIVGALMVAATFVVSAVVLVLGGNIPLAIVTLVVTALLAVIVKQGRHVGSAESA